MNSKFITIFFLLGGITASTMAMHQRLSAKNNPWINLVNEEDGKIKSLLEQTVSLPADEFSDEELLKQNPGWQKTRNWPQTQKDALLRKIMETLFAPGEGYGKKAKSSQKYANRRGHIALAIAVGADPKTKSFKARSLAPIMISIYHNDPVTTHYLFKKGATLDKSKAETFLRETKNTKMAELLLECGVNPSADILFEKDLSPEVMGVYLKRGVRPLQDKRGRTPLHQVAGRSFQDSNIIKAKAAMLIDAGVNLEAQDDDGDTALHIAAVFGTFELCKVILDGCIENHKKHRASIVALLYCTGSFRKRRPTTLHLSKDLIRAYFKSPHSASPSKLLTIRNRNSRTPLMAHGYTRCVMHPPTVRLLDPFDLRHYIEEKERMDNSSNN